MNILILALSIFSACVAAGIVGIVVWNFLSKNSSKQKSTYRYKSNIVLDIDLKLP